MRSLIIITNYILVEEREDTISANLKRYMHNPVIVSKAITGVAVDKIKSIKSSLLKGNNGKTFINIL